MIMCFVGKPGKGKTLAAVHRALLMLVAQHKRGNKNYRVYSNITLKLPEEAAKYYTKIESHQQIDAIKNGVFLFDEMWKWVDSRVPTSKANRFWSSWSIITRKRKIDLIYTEQYEKLIDLRIREITDYLCKPFQDVEDEELSANSDINSTVYKYTIVELQNLNDLNPTYYYYGIVNRTIFGLYDTYEEPKELEGGTYLDEAEEIICQLPADPEIQGIEKKGEVIGHIMKFYRCSRVTAQGVFRKVYSGDCILMWDKVHEIISKREVSRNGEQESSV